MDDQRVELLYRSFAQKHQPQSLHQQEQQAQQRQQVLLLPGDMAAGGEIRAERQSIDQHQHIAEYIQRGLHR